MGWLEIFEEKLNPDIGFNSGKKQSSVLLVDDDPEMLNVMAKYLTNQDYYIYTAKNGVEAFEIYKSQSPAIIVTDILMKGMNGIELLSSIRETDQDTEIIVITGHGDMSMAIKALRNKASDFLVKPVDFEILIHAIQKSESHIKLKEDIKTYTQELEELFKDVHHSRDYLETVLKNSPNATITYDTKGIITSWNEAAEKLTGFLRSETIGKTVKEIFVFDHHLIDVNNTEIRQVKQQNITGQILTKNHEMRYISRNANVLVDQSNSIIGGIESFYDITEKTNSDRLLEKRYMQVQTINEIGKKVAGSIKVDELIEFISKRLVSTFFESANIYFLMSVAFEDKLNLRAVSGISSIEVLKKYPIGSEISIKKNMIGQVFKDGQSLLCSEVARMKNLNCSIGNDVYSAFAFPIKSPKIRYGVIHIENSERMELDDSDIFMMETIAEYLAISLDKIELMEKITKQNELLEKQAKDLKKAFKKEETQKEIIEDQNKNLLNDLNKASEFQKTLLPEYLPQIEKYRFSVSFTPSSQLGGDYYDVFMINERFLGLLVADATGHGVSSAMLSAMFKMTLSKYSSFDLNPGSVFNKLNQDFCQVLQTGDFFTAFYGIIDLHTNKFMYSNAGHPLPLLYNYSSGDIINLDSEGFILGAMHKGITYETKEFRFNDHYRMLIYTDCLFEEVNNTQKPFGLNRVRNSIARYAQESPDKYLDNIVRDLKKFTGKSIFSDDLTLLVIDIIL